jgi:hypothetical protein
MDIMCESIDEEYIPNEEYVHEITPVDVPYIMCEQSEYIDEEHSIWDICPP